MSNGPTGHELLSWDMTKTKPLAEHGQGHTEAGRGAAPNDHPLTVGLRSGVGQFLLRHPSLSRRLAAPIEEEYVVGLDLHPGSIRSSLLLCGYSVRWPVQELDLPGDDLGAVVLDALVLFVVPATRLEPPLDVDEGAFLEVLIAEFRKALPYYNAMSKILILSSALDDERVLAAVRAGADGTSSGPAGWALIQAIMRVAQGQRVLDPAVPQVLVDHLHEADPLASLSVRERVVFDQLARG